MGFTCCPPGDIWGQDHPVSGTFAMSPEPQAL